MGIEDCQNDWLFIHCCLDHWMYKLSNKQLSKFKIKWKILFARVFHFCLKKSSPHCSNQNKGWNQRTHLAMPTIMNEHCPNIPNDIECRGHNTRVKSIHSCKKYSNFTFSLLCSTISCYLTWSRLCLVLNNRSHPLDQVRSNLSFERYEIWSHEYERILWFIGVLYSMARLF